MSLKNGLRVRFPFFVPNGSNTTLANMFETQDELIQYWARVLCPIPQEIIDALMLPVR